MYYDNPCIPCTKQGGAEQKMMPIIDEQEAAFLERPFRTQATNAPDGCGREQHVSNMLWRQSRLERLGPSILHLRIGWRGTHRAFCGSATNQAAPVEHSAAPVQARAAISSQLRLLARLQRQFRAAISSQLRFRARLERPLRASCGSGPSSTGNFEPTAAPGQARSRKPK